MAQYFGPAPKITIRINGKEVIPVPYGFGWFEGVRLHGYCPEGVHIRDGSPLHKEYALQGVLLLECSLQKNHSGQCRFKSPRIPNVIFTDVWHRTTKHTQPVSYTHLTLPTILLV